MTKKIRIILTAGIVVVIAIVISIIVIVNMFQNELRSLEEVKIADIDLSLLPDGAFKGQFSTGPVSAIVEVTVQDNKISAIKIIKHNNGQGQPAEEIIDKVIDKQTLDVDVVSGATYSSIVLLKSIENALVKASRSIL